jgi:hypothetical protein
MDKRKPERTACGSGSNMDIPDWLKIVDTDVELTAPAPQARILFNGKTLHGWLSRKGGSASWDVFGGRMEVVPGAGDIYTAQTFRNFHLHIEFRLPFLPNATGQERANSGVYLQGLYEIQVLDSFGLPSKDNDCGALYRQAAPLINACKKPERWQSFDLVFRAPQFSDAGDITTPGHLTAFQNGMMIHNNIEVWSPTGRGLEIRPGDPGPILLQDHGDRVQYRNIWILAGA